MFGAGRAALGQQQGDPRQLGQRHSWQLREHVAVGHDQHEFVFDDGLGRDALVTDAHPFGNEGAVHLAIHQHVDRPPHELDAHADLDARVLLAEGRQQVRQQVAADGLAGANREVACPGVAQVRQLVFHACQTGGNFLGGLQHDLAGAGQRDLLAVAVEQLHLEGFFQRLHLGADGRLGEMQDLGGAREAVQVRHGRESAQLRQRQHDSGPAGAFISRQSI